MHFRFKVTSHKATFFTVMCYVSNSKTSILSHMIYFASTTRIEGSGELVNGDHSDSVIKKRQKMWQFFYPISCIYFIMIF
jgi:hypothetical protein